MQKEALEIAINSAPVTISWISDKFIYLGVNPQLASIMGKNPQDIIGTPLGSYTDHAFVLSFAKRLFASSQIELSEEISAIINDNEKWFHILGRKYDNNTKATLIGIDITAQKEAQRHSSLSEKLALIGEMASGLLHEINNPLTTINLKTQKLKRLDFNKTDEIKQQVLEIAEELLETENRINKIIKTMKEFAHLTPSGEQPKEPKPLAPLIEQAINLCEAKLTKHNIILNLDIDEHKVPVYDTEIIQIMVNLITNAVDALVENQIKEKWIHITSKIPDNFCFISVTDAGTGIPKHLQKKILEPFFTTKEKGKGTGIGLGLCQKFAMHHKGSFYIDNTSKNTRFVLKLPL